MPPSPGYLRENPNYRQAGDWRYDRDSRYTADGYRRSDGRKKIMGYSSKQWEPRASGIDEFQYRQDGYSPEQAKTLARQLAQRGYRKGFGGQGIEPNRSLSSRERRQLGLDKEQSSAPTGPTDDQRKWAKAFREKSTPQKPSAATAPKEPLNFSRSALVEGAKQTGDFKKIREGFNTQSAAAQTGMRMNERGVVETLSKTKVGADGLTDYAREKFGPAVADIRARRDFATNKSTSTSGTTGMAQQDNGARPTQAQDFRRTITSDYGDGTNVSRTPGQGSGTTVDPLTGKTVPMKNALADQSAVQKTKEPGSTSGEGYFDPKAIRQSVQKGRRV